MKNRKIAIYTAAGLAGLGVPVVLGASANGQGTTVTCPPGVTAPSPYCVSTPNGTGTTGTSPNQNPPGGNSNNQAVRITKMTVKVRPKRARKIPFRITVSGKLTPQGGGKCSGRVRVTAKRGKRTVAKTTRKVKSNCTYRVKSKKITRKKLKARKGKLTIRTRFLGNATFLAKSGKKKTLRFG